VAFYAYLESEQKVLPVGHIIKYDGVDDNYGGGYDNNTGIFTCPTTGLYLFNVFIHPVHVSLGAVSLKRNGGSLTHAIAQPSFNGQDLIGSTARPVWLNQGDRVWVEVILKQTDMWSSYTTFSGHLVHR